jgi:hypothetical protein
MVNEDFEKLTKLPGFREVILASRDRYNRLTNKEKAAERKAMVANLKFKAKMIEGEDKQ